MQQKSYKAAIHKSQNSRKTYMTYICCKLEDKKRRGKISKKGKRIFIDSKRISIYSNDNYIEGRRHSQIKENNEEKRLR